MNLNLKYCKPETFDDAIAKLLRKSGIQQAIWMSPIDIWRAALETALGVLGEEHQRGHDRAASLRDAVADRLADLRDAGRP
jgi:hypothetical protein